MTSDVSFVLMDVVLDGYCPCRCCALGVARFHRHDARPQKAAACCLYEATATEARRTVRLVHALLALSLKIMMTCGMILTS